jgi:hypothetical protein
MKDKIHPIIAAAIAALKPLEQQFGVTFAKDSGSISYNDQSFTMKIAITANAADGKAVSKQELDWDKYANVYSLDKTLLGKSILMNGKPYKIVGLNPKKRVKPVVIEGNGKTYITTVDAVNTAVALGRVVGGHTASPSAPPPMNLQPYKGALAKYIDEQNSRGNLFGRKTLPDADKLTKQEILDIEQTILWAMEPESISCDGECSRTEVNRKMAKYRAIMTDLERLANKQGFRLAYELAITLPLRPIPKAVGN